MADPRPGTVSGGARGAPRFSILVPTCNQARYLPAALDSILAQSVTDWEAVVVNDGSSDETPAIVDAYAARDPRIVPVHKPNGGVASALNAGLARARGDWILWLSSDDLFEPEKLAIHARWIDARPECAFFFSYFRLLRESTGAVSDVDLWGPLPKPDRFALGLLYRNFVSGITICVAQELFRDLGGFDERYRYAQDYDCWMRILRDREACFIPEYTVTSRNHADQGSEVFPEACYFDTARAAIAHINERAFETWFPGADLWHEDTALSILDDALAICRDPSAFCYGLGPHGGLLGRIVEWVLGVRERSPTLGDRLLRRLREASREAAREGGAIGPTWCMLDAALGEESLEVRFAPVDPLGTALRSGMLAPGTPQARAGALEEYLSRFMGVAPRPLRAPGRAARVLLVDTGEGARLEPAAQRLAAAGVAVWRLAGGPGQLEIGGGVTRVRLPLARPSPQRWLPMLGEFDEVVGWAPQAWRPWFRARWREALRSEGSPADGAWPDAAVEPVLQRLEAGGGADDRRLRVVFMQRTLAGGGAERVVHALAHALDPRRFVPVVVTLCDDRAAPAAYAPDIALACLGGRAGEADARSTFQHRIRWQPRGAFARRVLLRNALRAEYLLWRVRRSLGYRLRDRARRLLVRLREGADAGVVRAERGMARIVGEDNLTSLEARRETGEPIGRQLVATALWRRRWRELAPRPGPHAVVVSVMEEAAICAWQCPDVAIPRVVSLHTQESRYLPSMYPGDALEAARWGLVGACASARSVVFPSLACQEDFAALSGLPGGNFAVIPNPVDCARLRWLSAEPVPQALAALVAEPYAVHLARLAPEKNHLALLDAVTCARERHPGLRVLCVGDGPRRNGLEEEIRRRGLEGNVLLVGHLDNPYPLLARARALVLTSDFESFGLVILEAWCLETPVVSATGEGGPAELLHDGVDGLSVPPGDAQALADALLRVDAEATLRETLAAGGLARVAAFDAATVAQRWAALLEGACAPAPDARGSQRSLAGARRGMDDGAQGEHAPGERPAAAGDGEAARPVASGGGCAP